MAELNLKQITNKLNTEFTGEVRKLVFWYDENADFVEDVDSLALSNAKVLHLERDNQFYVKYFLECVDTTTNYLVYAPFAKPAIADNHLEDTVRYSKEFFADRASLLMLDLGINHRLKPVIQKHISFFGAKTRTQSFYDLELETYTRTTIELGMMSVLCKCKIPNYEEILRIVLTEGGFEDNPYLATFAKYDLLDAFWRMAEDVFGYADPAPTLEKYILSLFATYADRTIDAELPVSWGNYVCDKAGNTIAFLDNLMNSYVYSERFDEISAEMYGKLNGDCELRKLPADALVGCNLFAGVEDILIDWVIGRLLMEDVAAKLANKSIVELAAERSQKHFGMKRIREYSMLTNAWKLIANTECRSSCCQSAHYLRDLAGVYTNSAYQMDRWYREYYYYHDKMEDASQYEQLTELVENIYSNDYLGKICPAWTELYQADHFGLGVEKQSDFYENHIGQANSKNQIVVIISDAMRYEVGVSLLEKLEADEKCKANLKVMQTGLPSITSTGMAVLLPHNTVELDEEYKITVDGNRCGSTTERTTILRNWNPNSVCLQFDEIKSLTGMELRERFTRQEVVYIYHNQIDARGDSAHTENEVFNACKEAVDEIAWMIRRLTTNANRSHFFVTSDHGFLYQRKKLTEGSKLSVSKSNDNSIGKRYFLSDTPLDLIGTRSVSLSRFYVVPDEQVISFPAGADIYKTPGAGLNYVHGGCSPQEMLIPLLEVKTEKSKKETTTAQIAPLNLTAKIHNLVMPLDFIQTEPVSDVVKETRYRIFFVDEAGYKISNEHIYVADKKAEETAKRVFRLKFTFKNRKYDRYKKHYLVAYDDNNSLEVIRQEVIIDIAFADDFGFGF